MSIDVMKLVWDKSQHKETNLVALLALADMANIDGFCWPSHDTLAKRCRCNRRNIVYIIEKLEASGELYVEHNRGRNRSNRYMITIDVSAAKLADLFVKYFDLPASEAVEEAKKHIEKCAIGVNNVQPTAHLDNVQSVAHFSKENVQSSVNNVQPDALKCATDCTRSVIEPSIEPKRESAAVIEPLPTPAAQPSLQQPSFNTGSKYQNKQQNQVSEYIKKAKAFGKLPSSL